MKSWYSRCPWPSGVCSSLLLSRKMAWYPVLSFCADCALQVCDWGFGRKSPWIPVPVQALLPQVSCLRRASDTDKSLELVRYRHPSCKHRSRHPSRSHILPFRSKSRSGPMRNRVLGESQVSVGPRRSLPLPLQHDELERFRPRARRALSCARGSGDPDAEFAVQYNFQRDG